MDARRKRLLYQSTHRGMKETDILLGRFAMARLAELSPVQLARFEALLAESDNDLVDWITGRVPVPSAHDHDVMASLKSFGNER